MTKGAPVVGFEGIYRIYKNGVVVSLERRVNHSTPGINRTVRRYIKKPKMSQNGYWIIRLSRGGQSVTRSIHRLLAEAFIPNPENKRCVNHINGNKKDNRLRNLEWSTDSENIAHAYRTGLKIGVNQYILRKGIVNTK